MNKIRKVILQVQEAIKSLTQPFKTDIIPFFQFRNLKYMLGKG